MSIHRVFLSLGTNLEDRLKNLADAIKQLSSFAVIKKTSRIYETEPWGYADQPKFLNLATEVETNLDPIEMLSQLRIIEKAMGRKAAVRYGPRLIDLDILFYDDLVLETPELIIPHPRISERAFVLVPLAEIAPRLVHPKLGKTIKQLLQYINTSGVLLFEDKES